MQIHSLTVGGAYGGTMQHSVAVKGLVHPKMKILSVLTHSHVVSTP